MAVYVREMHDPLSEMHELRQCMSRSGGSIRLVSSPDPAI